MDISLSKPKIISLFLLGIFLITGCTGGTSDTKPTTAVATATAEEEGNEEGSVQAASDSPAETPTVDLTSDGIIVQLTGDDRVQLGIITPVTVELIGNQAIGELHLEALLPMLYFQVVDFDTDTEAVEVVPEIPVDKVLRNEVVNGQTLYFGVRDLDLAESGGRLALCTITLRAVAVGEEDISLYLAGATSPEGETLAVEMPTEPFFITVQEEPVEQTSTPEATETPQPEPTATYTATPQPTPSPDATPVPDGTPTVTPHPAVSPTSTLDYAPGPLPPLSEVITEPINMQPDSIYYRIHPTQTLYRLSKMFGVTVEAIVAANDIQDVNAVRAGRVLRIPMTPPVGKTAYLVSSKETLYSTAKAFGLTVEELAALNGIVPEAYNDIEIGQWLILMPKD